MVKTVRIKSYEKGLYFRNDELTAVLGQGRHWFLNPFVSERVDIQSQRSPWLVHKEIDLIVKSGLLGDDATVIDLKDNERALVWVEGRFSTILIPGLYVYWNKFKDVKVEIVDTGNVRFEHREVDAVLKAYEADRVLEKFIVEDGHKGIFYVDGKYVEMLDPGRYLFWKNSGKIKWYHIDMRDKLLDVSGQDIMTADKVTLRLNAVVSYRVADALKSVSVVDDADQALYRETQLAIRAIIGTRDLDTLLSEKDTVSEQISAGIRKRAEEIGLKTGTVGIRDIILPGEMKNLLNKVTEAKKAAEANLISRREEVAAMRSQANSAKLLQESPTLMRLKELEVLEKVAGNSQLNVVLGEKGLSDRVVNII